MFYAHNPADGNPSQGDTFVFKNVLTNFGNGYDNKTGVFTAPMSGVYVFTLRVCVNDGKSIYYEIKQGKESILKGRQYKTSSRMCTAAVAFSYLKTGDSVSSGCSHVDTTTRSNIAESPTYYHSSFFWFVSQLKTIYLSLAAVLLITVQRALHIYKQILP